MQIASTLTAHTISAVSIGLPLWDNRRDTGHRNDRTPASPLTDEAKEHEQLLKRENIRLDFQIEYDLAAWSCHAEGTNDPSVSAATIFLPNLKRIDKEAYNFLLLRQFYYLKEESNNSRFYPGLVAASVFVIAYFSTYSPWLTCGATLLATFTAYSYHYRKNADAADDFAIANATRIELEGGIRYLKALKLVRKAIFNQSRCRLKEDDHVNLRLDFHSTLDSRIQKFKSEIDKRIQAGTAKRSLNNYDSDARIHQMKKAILSQQVNNPSIFPNKFNYLFLC